MSEATEKLYRWLMLADEVDIAILCANFAALFPDAKLEPDNPTLLTRLYAYLSNVGVHAAAYGSEEANWRFQQLVKGLNLDKAQELSAIYQELANNPSGV